MFSIPTYLIADAQVDEESDEDTEINDESDDETIWKIDQEANTGKIANGMGDYIIGGDELLTPQQAAAIARANRDGMSKRTSSVSPVSIEELVAKYRAFRNPITKGEGNQPHW